MISSTDKIMDLGVPQRQAAAGLIIEMIFALKMAIQILWPLILIFIFQINKIGILIFILGLLTIFILIIVFGYLNYRHFFFYIDEEKEEFILKSGVFNKKIVSVRFERIQQVNINQSFIQKLIHVYEVEIETAGSTKNEAKIRAVSKQTALYIRDRLLSGKNIEEEKPFQSEDIVNAAGENPDIPQIKISLSSLVKIALTSDYLKSLGIILAFIITVFDRLKESVFREIDMGNMFREYLSRLHVSQYILLIAGLLIVLVFVFNLLRFVLIYFDFTIRRQGRSLQFSYGLLNTKNTIIQPSKVQIVRLVTNFFQRKLNLSRMFISQASSDIQQDKKATIQLPGFNMQDGRQILQFLFHGMPVEGFMIKPTNSKVISAVNKFILVPVVFALILSWAKAIWVPFIIGVPIYLVVVSVLIYISYLNNRLFVHEDFIIKKSGIWDISTEIMEPYKIQAITTKQYPWHVKSNVGHLTLHTAGGDLSFKFGDFAAINNYANYWLYQVETSDKEWM
jgi:putative membrane protein